ncbi:MAG: MmgE/PrpD family protein, partial [Burkholderiales bacterium]
MQAWLRKGYRGCLFPSSMLKSAKAARRDHSAEKTMDKATELLARYATALRFEDLPPEVVHDAKRKLIDTLGCAIGAFDEEPCRIARALASRCVGRPPARIFGTQDM